MIQDFENAKCVLIVDSSLTKGEQANVAAILAMTIGAKNNEIIGEDISDADGIRHKGITRLNLPILTASGDTLRRIHEEVYTDDNVFLVDFTATAQKSRTYQAYSAQMNKLAESELVYIGIGIIGNKKYINKHSGNLKILR